MYDFPTSSTKRLPNIVSPSKKATTSTNGQPIQMVTMSGNRPVDDVGKPYIRPLVSGLEGCPACHPERSEGSVETEVSCMSS